MGHVERKKEYGLAIMAYVHHEEGIWEVRKTALDGEIASRGLAGGQR